MANSVKPGVHGPHHHRHHRRHPPTAAVPPKAPVPPRTPGPEGHNDASSPLLTTLLGWTPNLTGFRDWADHTLHEFEDWWNHTPGSTGRHPQTGQPMAAGALPPQAVTGEVALLDAQTMALQISTYFEGSVSMNYKALAGNGDGQKTSFGLVQWNFGQDTLGPLLNKMRAKDAATFDGCFGAGSNYDALKQALANGDSAAQGAWALGLLGSTAGKAAWKAAFHALGSVPAFNDIQRAEAVAKYHPAAVQAIADVRAIKSDVMQRVEFRTYAALYDLSVQQGSIKKVKKQGGVVVASCVENIKARVLAEKPLTQLDLMKIVVVERGKMAVSASQADAISRRMGILTGASYASTEGSSPTTRANPQFALITQHGAKNVTGL